MLIPKRAYPETVTLERYEGEDVYGNIRYADPVQTGARISYENKLVRNETGEEVVSNTQIMLPGDMHEHINIAGRITLPDHAAQSTMRVISGGPVYGWSGITHLQYDLR